MTDSRDLDPGPTDDRLADVLSRRGMWDEVDAATGDAIVEAIAGAAESGPRSRLPAERVRRWLGPIAAGVAAAALVLVVGVALIDDDSSQEPSGVAVELAGTEQAPDASAVAAVAETSRGTRIDLDVSGLAPAPAGHYYETWLWDDAGDGVSAGTFHLRGGDGWVYLWAGVTLDDYPELSVTLEAERDGPGPSGETVLRSEG